MRMSGLSLRNSISHACRSISHPCISICPTNKMCSEGADRAHEGAHLKHAPARIPSQDTDSTGTELITVSEGIGAESKAPRSLSLASFPHTWSRSCWRSSSALAGVRHCLDGCTPPISVPREQSQQTAPAGHLKVNDTILCAIPNGSGPSGRVLSSMSLDLSLEEPYMCRHADVRTRKRNVGKQPNKQAGLGESSGPRPQLGNSIMIFLASGCPETPRCQSN